MASTRSRAKNSRKRSPSLESTTVSLSDGGDNNSESVVPKRLKKADFGSAKESAILRNLSQSLRIEDTDVDKATPFVDDFLLLDNTTETSSAKRTSQPSEKAVYTRSTLDKKSPRKKLVIHGPAEIADPASVNSSRSSTMPVVKSEPVDDKALISGFSSGKLKAKHQSSPVIISSDEDYTPKAKSSLSHKSKATAEEYSDHGGSGSEHSIPDRALSSGDNSDSLPASILVPSPSKSPTKVKKPDVVAREPKISTFSSKNVYLEDLVPAPPKSSFVLVPFDNANSPAGCPAHLLHTSDDGTTSPIELVAGAFELFDGAAHQSILSALQFKELRPFVNVTAAARENIYAEKFKNHIMWQKQNRSVLFTMIGSVQSCHLTEPVVIGQYNCKAITIVPYGQAWRKFQDFLGQLYGKGQMRGPFDYGCLLTLSGRREGYNSADLSSMLAPVTPKKNTKAFGGSGVSSSAEWFDAKLPNCVDFDKPIPIYDASENGFFFGRDDFIGLPSLPRYTRHGNISDLPVDSVVSVFFALSSYAKRALGSGSVPASTSPSFNDILSFNIQFVVYYGVIPHDD